MKLELPSWGIEPVPERLRVLGQCASSIFCAAVDVRGNALIYR